ncbi:Phosphopantetheine attachment site [Nitrosomonas sp. Nm51]|uniref:acyl carrier protein n=1 Tax=Nitrosomonas sp. Nm51 TaxID=133720 RepID=UPI0008C98086|nr:acyl carrier protein [Nitrosomonas sp. Nm51]SER12337.1 Phosphopantetheine attachment site [Nitrosomonas sp. Nm51]
MKLENEIINIVRDVLVLGDRADKFNTTTALMGDIPEFDSMSVVAIITALEDEYDCVFEDDEITADVFKTIGSLTQLVESKL